MTRCNVPLFGQPIHKLLLGKMDIFWEICIFWRFFWIFSVTVLGKDLWFFALRSLHQDTSFELSKSTFGEKKSDFSA